MSVRRIHAAEWERVRDLRLDAVRDPDAAIAFLHSYDEESKHPDSFWQERAMGAATGDAAAQFVAETDGDWIGTLTVLRKDAGAQDHHGRVLTAPRGSVVGVYVRPEHRGAAVIDALFAAALDWARGLGDEELTLDVHDDNARAQGAYRRVGFVDTGVRFTGAIGAEIEMAMRVPVTGADRNGRVQA